MAKKKSTRKSSARILIRNNTVILVTKFPAEETLFPEKLKKANELLAKAKLMDR